MMRLLLVLALALVLIGVDARLHKTKQARHLQQENQGNRYGNWNYGYTNGQYNNGANGQYRNYRYNDNHVQNGYYGQNQGYYDAQGNYQDAAEGASGSQDAGYDAYYNQGQEGQYSRYAGNQNQNQNFDAQNDTDEDEGESAANNFHLEDYTKYLKINDMMEMYRDTTIALASVCLALLLYIAYLRLEIRNLNKDLNGKAQPLAPASNYSLATDGSKTKSIA